MQSGWRTNDPGTIPADILSEYNAERPTNRRDKICYAPSTHLYFGHSGKVTACCINRREVVGWWPNQSIEEIWQGEKMNQLRQFMAENNLGGGCAKCRSQVMSRNFSGTQSNTYDHLPDDPLGRPSSMSFELVNTCNLECKMCTGDFSSSIRKNREGLPPIPSAYDGRFVEQLAPFIPQLEEAKFFGGEPFLIDLYYDIWEKIIAINPETVISLQTNGTILNNRAKKLLENGRFNLGLSIDSLEPDNYADIRKNGKLSRVIEHFQWFYEYKKRKGSWMGVSMCLMSNNWWELPEFVRFCNHYDIQLYAHFVMKPYELSLASMSSKELGEVYAWYDRYDFAANTEMQKINRGILEGWKRQVKRWEEMRKQIEAGMVEATDRALAMTRFEGKLKRGMAIAGMESQVFDRLVKRLNQVLDELGDQFLYPALDTISDEEFARALETLTLDELLESAWKRMTVYSAAQQLQ